MNANFEYNRFHAQSKIQELQQEGMLNQQLKLLEKPKMARRYKMKKKLFVGTFLLVLLFTISTARVALADPTNNPNTFTATLQCGSGTVTFVVLPAGSPTLLDLNSSGGFHLTQVDFTIVETGATGTVPYGAGNGQANGVQDDLVTCSVTEVRDGLTFEFDLTGFFTPQ